LGHAGQYDRTPVYDRYALTPGSRVEGPAIVEEREATVLVPPGSLGRVDGYRNLVVDWQGALTDNAGAGSLVGVRR
jgi:N-methylhydantoinase A/oxoprolinase/acetone carboxylase beta subunit